MGRESQVDEFCFADVKMWGKIVWTGDANVVVTFSHWVAVFGIMVLNEIILGKHGE